MTCADMAREAVAAVQAAARTARPEWGFTPPVLPVDYTLPAWTTRATGNPLYPLGWVCVVLVERDGQLGECAAGGLAATADQVAAAALIHAVAYHPPAAVETTA